MSWQPRWPSEALQKTLDTSTDTCTIHHIETKQENSMSPMIKRITNKGIPDTSAKAYAIMASVGALLGYLLATNI